MMKENKIVLTREEIKMQDALILEMQEFLYNHDFDHVYDNLNSLKRAVIKDNKGAYIIRKDKRNNILFYAMEKSSDRLKRREKAFTLLNYFQQYFANLGLYLGEYQDVKDDCYGLYYLLDDEIKRIVYIDVKSSYLKIEISDYISMLLNKSLPHRYHHNKIPLIVLDHNNPLIMKEEKKLLNEGYISLEGSYKEQCEYFKLHKYMIGRIISLSSLKKSQILLFNIDSKEKIGIEDNIEENISNLERKELNERYNESLKDHLEVLKNRAPIVKLCKDCALKLSLDTTVLMPFTQRLNLMPCIKCHSLSSFDYHVFKLDK